MDCPTCEKSLSSERGMRQHHTKVHGEPLPNRTCNGCEREFYDPKARRTYCGECYSERGTQNGNWKNAKEQTECDRCGSEFRYYPSEKDGVYCSDCVEEAEEFLGTPSYETRDVKRVDRECEQCSERFSVLATTLQREPCRFCSHRCLCNWMSKEGELPSTVYNGDWWSVRHDALDRDNHQCRICGKTEDEIGQKPDVHHIEPIRTFDNHQDAHELSNVITLCRKCHINVERGNLPCPKPDTLTESRKG